MRPCISLSCCVTFLRATYAFKCCSQSLPAARGARVRNPSVPGKVAQKNQPRDRAGRKLQPNQLCTRPACQQVRYFARRAVRCAQESALQGPDQWCGSTASAAGTRPELCTSLTISRLWTRLWLRHCPAVPAPPLSALCAFQQQHQKQVVAVETKQAVSIF